MTNSPEQPDPIRGRALRHVTEARFVRSIACHGHPLDKPAATDAAGLDFAMSLDYYHYTHRNHRIRTF